MADAVEAYEAAQNYSGLTSWLHGFRFRHLVRTAQRLATPGRPLNVLELGCAYGKAFSALDTALPVRYAGVDPHATFIAEARRLYGARENFRVVCEGAETFVAREGPSLGPLDLVFALETLEHIHAMEAVRLIERIAALRPRLFVASVPVEIGPAIVLKNLGSALTGYQRHREYALKETLWAGLYRLDKVAPHARGHKGFDWRWLAHTIHQAMPIVRIRRFPANWLPAALATSVYIEAAPR
jgi:SAM-dependent methyltransferase